MKFYPYEKGGSKSFSHTEGGGGHKKCWGSFYAVARSFRHTEGGGGTQNVSTFYLPIL